MDSGVASRGWNPEADAGAPKRLAFRPDVDGLRAIAVLLVLLFHAGTPGFEGGFVGVDVFFVLSGFVITRGLVIEADHSRRIDVIGFWLRRARRLLPAAGVMISVATAAQLMIRSPLVWDTVLSESSAAATYWSNEQATNISGGYFGAKVEDRALLHTWSLSVEEQFYIIWPVLFAGLVRSKMRPGLRTAVTVALVVLSATRSAQLLGLGSPGAYFKASSRAWEFLTGAALALNWNRLVLVRTRLASRRGLLASGGLVLVLTSAFWLGGSTGFPWPYACAPVAGTIALLFAEVDQTHLLGRLMSTAGMQLIGRLSYSWYLWHWPVLVLGRELIGRNDQFTSFLLVLGSISAAYASYRFIETPLRHRRSPSRAREVSIAFVVPVALTLAAVGAGFLYRAWIFTDPLMAQVEVAADGWPEHLGGCYQLDVVGFEQRCTFGAPSGKKTILVVGDSHAAHWMPTFDEIGKSNQFRVVALQVGSCPLLSSRSLGDEANACSDLRAGLQEAIATLAPDLVIASASESYIDRDRGDLALWRDGHHNFATILAKPKSSSSCYTTLLAGRTIRWSA